MQQWRPARRGAIRPAMFSSSTANGSAFRWRSIPSGASAATRPSRHLLHGLGAQAHALGRSGGARGEGDLGGARAAARPASRSRRAHRSDRPATATGAQRSVGHSAGQRRIDEQRVDAGRRDRVLHLRRREEERQGHMNALRRRSPLRRSPRRPARCPWRSRARARPSARRRRDVAFSFGREVALAPGPPTVVQRRPHGSARRREKACRATSIRPASTTGRWS